MGRFIVIVLDGFGIGAMPDVREVRPADINANTCRHIFEDQPVLFLPALEGLGLMNAAGFETEMMRKSKAALFGRIALKHDGADTFFGHQEIMGTSPKKPFGEPIKNKLAAIYDILKKKGYDVQYYNGKFERLLLVDNAITIADNIECDRGQAFNVTAALDCVPFECALEIGKLVRGAAVVPRVIVFGGRGVTPQNLLDAIEETGDGYIGVNAPKSGVYNSDYHCIHLGYGVDAAVQAPALLAAVGIPVFLLGKVADVVQNPGGKSFSIVETGEVLSKTKEIILENKTAFICANVQETDLSGHRESAAEYARILRLADAGIDDILPLLSDEDILLVIADHGNDPTIGHPHHTREFVPLLVYKAPLTPKALGTRKTLSDVAATVCKYFSAAAPQAGESFLQEIEG